ncbi:PD-(D/E)XK nuclease family protein [Ramlibacter sp. WS9]|uniref:PD-(D/E)XK nuclease family protein n=1 Tax=Ramlibacter sp. WS9 TaxID=1882741 RepID=UPI001E5A2879|nr:PD-(D/E)XK nuclease family protein [Ramlibacter sp. WS9]
MRALMSRVRELMAARCAHPARTIVLLPYFQLLPVARGFWAEQVPSGFSPRFETTQSWAGEAGFEHGANDISFDRGRDLLTARTWLEHAGLGARADLLAARVVEAASQLAEVAAGVPAEQRAAWADEARAAVASGLDAQVLQLEAAVARVALEWAAASSYAGDALLAPSLSDDIDLLVVVEGLRNEPLVETLKSRLGVKAVSLPLDIPGDAGEVSVYEAADPATEAEMAAACVLRHVDAGRMPVALAAIDRVLTRRVRAMLDARKVAIRDETGWKLSTTRAAADVMLALRGSAWNASADSVIDWLKNAPDAPSWTVLALERRVRRAGVREWRTLRREDLADGQHELLDKANRWREELQAVRLLPQWLASLRAVLQSAGQWPGLERDAAGAKVLVALYLDEEAHGELGELPQARRRFSLAEFTAWANEALEAASFVPEPSQEEQVVILPFNQLLGRPFAALVMAGCDEVRLPPSPEPPGLWTAAQRERLGLPSRETLEAELRAGWRHALQTPTCDLLLRRSDESGEPLLPSALVQVLQLEGRVRPGLDPREERELETLPTPKPLPVGRLLPLPQLSASAYEDLRRCPYRFFALRQLGLQEADEIDTELDKRDFGNWLHQVLRAFHESLAASWEPHGPARTRLLDITADEVTRAQRFDEGEFLPFAAAWPQVRDGYLTWLQAHEAKEGAVFQKAESEHEIQLGDIKLVGRIDRIDRLADGRAMVMDYKTEARATSADRVKQPVEDTQLAFYATLLHDDTLRAAYINVGERGKTETVEQVHVVEARDLLVQGILDELARVSSGETLPALGEGKACDFCAARGLCRRDFWS